MKEFWFFLFGVTIWPFLYKLTPDWVMTEFLAKTWWALFPIFAGTTVFWVTCTISEARMSKS